jgi:tripartite-type tricarboxylate transporter receptor subunit TctC
VATGVEENDMWKRLLCAAILAHASFSVWAASGTADSYPNKPLRAILGFPPGGSDDYLARIIGPKLTERFGQTVIVDNRPGAAANIGAEITAGANPDGYTLFLGPSTLLAASRSLYPKLGYDLLKDFSYISRVATGGTVLLAHPSLPAKSVSELVALAHSKPKTIPYGSAGVASLAHLSMELLQSRTGMELLHVAYKGAASNAIALTGGEVKIGFSSVAAALPMIQAKRLNALAVTTAKRLGVLPEVPTVAESGVPGYDVTITFGILAPTGTPAAVVKLLNTEIRNIVQMDDVRAKFAAQALDAVGSTPDEYRAITEAETAQWARVIKDAHITAN